MANTELGFILYRGKSLIGAGNIVCVATLESANVKTGNMIQIWIIPDDTDPLDALHNGNNESACGRCPLQGKAYTAKNGKVKMQNRVCYVNVGQAPKAVYRSFRAGKYPEFNREYYGHYFANREIRIGAYGDPAALPVKLVRWLANVGAGWTGYSHQLFWIDQRRANVLAQYLMVSCHTPAQHAEAKRRGWRSFVAIADGQQAPLGAVQCPNYTHGVQCIDCKLCQGTSKRARDVYVIGHGKVANNLPIIQQLQGNNL